VPAGVVPFQELSPQIDHLGSENYLYAFWRLDRMEGTFRYLRKPILREKKAYYMGMAIPRGEDSLRRAVARGTLLQAPSLDQMDRRSCIYEFA